jgi:hypothetical protein
MLPYLPPFLVRLKALGFWFYAMRRIVIDSLYFWVEGKTMLADENMRLADQNGNALGRWAGS